MTVTYVIYHNIVLNLLHCSLIDDIRSERLTKLNTRKSLEQSWDHSIQEKQCQLMEELNHSKQPSILLHQQCEKYHRSEKKKNNSWLDYLSRTYVSHTKGRATKL